MSHRPPKCEMSHFRPIQAPALKCDLCRIFVNENGDLAIHPDSTSLLFGKKRWSPKNRSQKKSFWGEYLHDILVGWQKLKKDVLCVWRGKRFKIDLKVAKTIIFFVWVRRARYMGCVRRKIEVNKKWASLCSDWQKTQQRWPVFLACKTV